MLIPARSGSMGLRHKNVRKLHGKPLLAYAIETARAAQSSKDWRVIVSTDSAHYARIARHYGAETPFMRPQTLATSTTRLIDVLKHAMRECAIEAQPSTLDRSPQQPCQTAILMLSCSTPLTAASDIKKALRLFWSNSGHRAVISVCRDRLVPSRRVRMDASNTLSFNDDQVHRIGPRQLEDDPWRYYMNGAIFVASPWWLRHHHQFMVTKQTLAVEMPTKRSVDIKDQLDLRWAEFLLDRNNRG